MLCLLCSETNNELAKKINFMKEIENREDIYLLVKSFYKVVRKNDLLGPIFNQQIQAEAWPKHLDKLTDFWYTNLFGVPAFKGNPIKAHLKVDKDQGNTITQLHFDTWVKMWYETVDSIFEGELAERAKKSATNMSVRQYMVVMSGRETL